MTYPMSPGRARKKRWLRNRGRVFTAGQGVELDISAQGDVDEFKTAGRQASTYIDLLYKVYCVLSVEVTERFTDALDRLVITPLLRHLSFTPEILATGKSIEVCGEHQLYALLKAPAGGSRTGQDGDDIGMDLLATEEVQRTLWQYTEEVIGGIE
ncbi:hypothetical protein C8R45DRAFT_939518 [Mycena sanguinolenta]|nr:hypothetical protein C8R45DRAFT_939518 [Mycena sanguinolenta]